MSCVDTMIHIMGKTFVLFAKLCGIKRISDKTRPTVCDGTFVGLGQFFLSREKRKLESYQRVDQPLAAGLTVDQDWLLVTKAYCRGVR